jgi:hypothetical protein
MSERFKGKINVDIRDSVPDWSPFEPPKLARRGMPVVVTGFATENDAFQAPDESFRVEGLRQGEAAARELLPAMASLPR